MVLDLANAEQVRYATIDNDEIFTSCNESSILGNAADQHSVNCSRAGCKVQYEYLQTRRLRPSVKPSRPMPMSAKAVGSGVEAVGPVDAFSQ